MRAAPAVSVIIPVYNVEKYLERCLDSVLCQSFHDIEVICVDDGSTDTSPEILSRYRERDERVRIITQKNQGVSVARNAGLDAATGEWVAFVDSDDEVMPNIWESLLANAADEDAICFSAEEVFQQNGEQKIIHSGYFDIKYSKDKKINDDEVLTLSMTVWDKLFRRSKIESCTIRFPLNMRFEDNVFILNFFASHRNVRFFSQKLYRYFRNEGSLTDLACHHKEELAFDYIRILDHIHIFWTRHGFLPQMQHQFERICFDRFREAIKICQPWEQPGIVYSLSQSLRKWGLQPACKELAAIKEGKLSIHMPFFPYKNVTLLKPLKGLQKLFYIGNCQDRRVLLVFGVRLASWKKE